MVSEALFKSESMFRLNLLENKPDYRPAKKHLVSKIESTAISSALVAMYVIFVPPGVQYLLSTFKPKDCEWCY